MKKAVITILGIQGGFVGSDKKAKFSNFENRANYYFENLGESSKKPYFNTLPLLIEKYSSSHRIVPIYTEDAKIFNEAVLKEGYQNLELTFDDRYLIRDEKDFKSTFKLINDAVSEFDEIIVDVSHGFRHLPILMIVDLVIQNFQNSEKVKNIFFAKEIIKHERDNRGLYEIIDLKEYLELANISFLLTSFEKNYTVASHIKSAKYAKLIDALNDFSNDIMALNLTNLFKTSSKELIAELNKITDISIESQAKRLADIIADITRIEGKKRYQTYFDLSKNLLEKNYTLLSLSLLYESIRLYVKSYTKSKHKEIVEKIEDAYNQNLYAIGDFFVRLKNYTQDYQRASDGYEKYCKDRKKPKKPFINQDEFDKLKKAFPDSLKKLIESVANTRNNLAHANSDEQKLKDIKDTIERYCKQYEEIIKPKTSSDLKEFFKDR